MCAGRPGEAPQSPHCRWRRAWSRVTGRPRVLPRRPGAGCAARGGHRTRAGRGAARAAPAPGGASRVRLRCAAPAVLAPRGVGRPRTARRAGGRWSRARQGPRAAHPRIPIRVWGILNGSGGSGGGHGRLQQEVRATLPHRGLAHPCPAPQAGGGGQSALLRLLETPGDGWGWAAASYPQSHSALWDW